MADMVFPSEMIVNIDPRNLVVLDCCRGLLPKERQMLELNFFCLSLKMMEFVFFILTESLLHFSQTSIFWGSSLSTGSKQFGLE